MFEAAESSYLVPFDGPFRVADAPTRPPPGTPDEDTLEDRLDDSVDRLYDLQRMLYEDALNATSRPWAPWYAIPADDRDYMRMTVADIIVRSLEGLGLAYPTVSDEAKTELDVGRQALESE